MRIGVNLLFLVPGEVGASEALLVNLVRSMSSSGHRIVVFGLRGLRGTYPDLFDQVQLVEAPWSRGRQGLRIAAENTWLGWQARRWKLDVIHHGVGTTPLLKTVPSVATIHDIQYRHYPANFAAMKLRWLSFNVPMTLRSCRMVSVPSEWVKRDLVEQLGADAEKVTVVPFGSEDPFAGPPADPDEARSRYRLDRPFLLYPARSYVHKNHRFLLEAYKPVSERCDLVLTGAPWPRDRELADAARGLGLSGRVRQLGLIDRRDLGGLYLSACALVYPSRFEGFGAPILEAMSVGCPVIASDATCIPEVVGEAGVLLDPDDLDGWTETISRVLEDDGYAANLATKGRERASGFNWERSARLQIETYERALA